MPQLIYTYCGTLTNASIDIYLLAHLFSPSAIPRVPRSIDASLLRTVACMRNSPRPSGCRRQARCTAVDRVSAAHDRKGLYGLLRLHRTLPRYFCGAARAADLLARAALGSQGRSLGSQLAPLANRAASQRCLIQQLRCKNQKILQHNITIQNLYFFTEHLIKT